VETAHRAVGHRVLLPIPLGTHKAPLREEALHLQVERDVPGPRVQPDDDRVPVTLTGKDLVLHHVEKVTRARILLKAAEGWENSAMAAALSVGRATVERTRQRFVEEGLGTLEERPRPGKQPKLDAKAQARLIAEACSAAPEGRQC
jgi:hypothetical protein